jgi:DNA-binding response OmpR family regulator/HPt (histidine-containing phosphotransfer) domain-containing protein
MKILLIEDDDALITLLTRSLVSQHHIIDAVKDGEMGWTYASTFEYSLIILDIMLPKLDGISLCKKLREKGCTTPILLLTAQDQSSIKVQGLEAGADDYVVKPFDINELIARVHSLLRRGNRSHSPLLSWGLIVLNPSNCNVTYDGKLLTLTTKEYDLLEIFLRDTHHVFSSDEIIDQLWSSDDFPAEATVRSHLHRLRSKLQAAGAPHDLIATVHGRGYYLKSSPAEGNAANNSTNTGLEQSDSNESLNTFDHVPQLNQSPDQHYLAFLQENWVTTRTKCLAILTELTVTVDRLISGSGNYLEQQQAHQQAHKLTGILGVFYLLSAMEIARSIESLLHQPTLLGTTEASALSPLLSKLSQAVVQNNPIIKTSNSQNYQSVLLLIDLDPALSLNLTTMAIKKNCHAITLSSVSKAIDYEITALEGTPESYLPTVVLVSLATNEDPTNLSRSEAIHHLYQQFPHWSILVLSNSNKLTDRLTVVQNGGKFLAINTLTDEQIFTAATSLFRSANDPINVVVVDDDVDWLRSLPQLLQPLGIRTTTLSDLSQLWEVLQSVQPDALILDISMPEINGLKLCQILRNDPHWQHLPILFLTAAHDLITQQQAFRIGADDYLCKPVLGSELAQRIRYRLARLQAVTYSPAVT